MKNAARISLAGLFLLFIASNCLGQAGKGTGLWDFKRFPAAESAVVVQNDEAYGSGVILQQGDILSAFHVVIHSAIRTVDETGVTTTRYPDQQIIYQDGTETTAVVIKFDTENDLVLLKPARLPAKVYSVKVATSEPRSGEQCFFAGFGGGGKKELRCWADRRAKLRFPGIIFYDTTGLHGDSGGPVFNAAGELIGLIKAGANQGPHVDGEKRFGLPVVVLMMGPCPAVISNFLLP